MLDPHPEPRPENGDQPMSHSVDPEYANNVRELVREAWSEYASSAKEAIYVAAGLYAIFEAVDLDRQRDDDKIKHAFEALIPAADRHYCRWLGIESADRAAVLTPVDIMRAVGLANKELQELCTRLESEDGPRIPL